jgi:hypothetical protein
LIWKWLPKLAQRLLYGEGVRLAAPKKRVGGRHPPIKKLAKKAD